VIDWPGASRTGERNAKRVVPVAPLATGGATDGVSASAATAAGVAGASAPKNADVDVV
jgi:hypothetical protein